MTDAATAVHASVGSLRDAFHTWAEAWEARLWLSRAHHLGGTHPTWHGGTVPTEVTAALATLTDALANLDTLAEDEAELTRWRETEAPTRAQSAVAS